MARKENIERQIEVLGCLIAACESAELNPRFQSLPGWVQPRMLGAWDASYHSGVLKTLCNKGLAERYKLQGMARKGACVYRPTEAGKIFYEVTTHPIPGG